MSVKIDLIEDRVEERGPYSIRVRTAKVQTGFYSHQVCVTAFLVCNGTKICEGTANGPDRVEVLTAQQILGVEERAIVEAIARAEEVKAALLAGAVKVLEEEAELMRITSGSGVYDDWMAGLIVKVRNSIHSKVNG